MKAYHLLLLFVFQSFLFSCTEENPISLELNKSEITLNIGEKETLTIAQAPVTSETLVWSSDNEDVATVFFGTVTAVGGGTATITASLGDEEAQCVVTVPVLEYQLVWSDEFDGTALNTSNWTYETGTGVWGWGNDEKQYYTNRTENIRVEDGLLVIEAKKEDYGGSQYTSARIKSANKQSFTYGRMEARLKLPVGVGTWAAYWMKGTNGVWPTCGEIDLMEHVGFEPKNIHHAVHSLNKNGMNGKNFSATRTLAANAADDFHTITVDWVENEIGGFDRIHFYVDGTLTKTYGETQQLQDSGDWPFNTPFFFVVNLAIGGNWGGTIDDSMFDSPVLFQVDYIRVYQLQ